MNTHWTEVVQQNDTDALDLFQGDSKVGIIFDEGDAQEIVDTMNDYDALQAKSTRLDEVVEAIKSIDCDAQTALILEEAIKKARE